MEYKQTQPHKKKIQYEAPCKPWEVVSVEIIFIKNEKFLCIVNYYSKFPIVKRLTAS